jgi:chitodextrinase
VPSNRAEITGLTQLSTHSIRIQAIDPAKNRSAQSAALSINTTDGLAPTVPTGVTTTATTKRGFTITWDASTDNIGVVGYHVYRNGSYVNTVKNGVRTFSFGNLAFNSSHQVSVVAFDLAGNKSAQSSAITVNTVFTVDPVAPSAPTNVTSNNVTTTQFTVSWSAATDNVAVTSYNIYRNGAYLATVSGAVTTYTLKNLSPVTAYNVVVRALDAERNGTDSAPITVTTVSDEG